MVTTATNWQLTGDYFENCNCDFICPCLFAPTGPLTQLPTEGYCDVALAFHVDNGRFGNTALDGLNVVAVIHADGPMGNGGWKMIVYMDDRADDRQREALGTIFSGNAGGPMAAFAPLIGEVIGSKVVPITFSKDGRRRSLQIPNIMSMAVSGLPSMDPESEVWMSTGHPVAPEKLAMATGDAGSKFSDFDISWDNSGKNGHYAPISWSGSAA